MSLVHHTCYITSGHICLITYCCVTCWFTTPTVGRNRSDPVSHAYLLWAENYILCCYAGGWCWGLWQAWDRATLSAGQWCRGLQQAWGWVTLSAGARVMGVVSGGGSKTYPDADVIMSAIRVRMLSCPLPGSGSRGQPGLITLHWRCSRPVAKPVLLNGASLTQRQEALPYLCDWDYGAIPIANPKILCRYCNKSLPYLYYRQVTQASGGGNLKSHTSTQSSQAGAS